MTRFWKRLPKLPFSALVFYFAVVILWNLNLIPQPSEIIIFLENLYETYGYMGLFTATFLESTVYLGLYVPGSFVIALSVFFSDHSFKSLFTITLIVAFTLTLTAIINYWLGRFIVLKTSIDKKTIKRNEIFSKGLLVSMLHPNLLAFYFFNAGLENHNFRKIIYVPIFMIPYGYFVAFLLSRFSVVARQKLESPTFLFSLIIIWLVVAYVIKHREAKNFIREQ